MDKEKIQSDLKQFNGSGGIVRHLHPGITPMFITEGCNYVRNECKAFWLFDAILSYQDDKLLWNVGFQIWTLEEQQNDLTWLLTCKEDSNKPNIIRQKIEYSDFPLEKLVVWVIDRVALLPSEY